MSQEEVSQTESSLPECEIPPKKCVQCDQELVENLEDSLRSALTLARHLVYPLNCHHAYCKKCYEENKKKDSKPRADFFPMWLGWRKCTVQDCGRYYKKVLTREDSRLVNIGTEKDRLCFICANDPKKSNFDGDIEEASPGQPKIRAFPKHHFTYDNMNKCPHKICCQNSWTKGKNECKTCGANLEYDKSSERKGATIINFPSITLEVKIKSGSDDQPPLVRSGFGRLRPSRKDERKWIVESIPVAGQEDVSVAKTDGTSESDGQEATVELREKTLDGQEGIVQPQKGPDGKSSVRERKIISKQKITEKKAPSLTSSKSSKKVSSKKRSLRRAQEPPSGFLSEVPTSLIFLLIAGLVSVMGLLYWIQSD